MKNPPSFLSSPLPSTLQNHQLPLPSHSHLHHDPPPSSTRLRSFQSQFPFTKPPSLHRSKTAPAISLFMQERESDNLHLSLKPPHSSSIITHSLFLLLIYLLVGLLIYFFNSHNFSGIHTHPLVDALYFCIVTMCTIGYGDIAPLTPATKIFACFFVLVGFGFIDTLLSGMVNYVLDLQETMILAGMGTREPGFSPIVDVKKGRMRIRLKVGVALGVVVLCVGIGTIGLKCVEGLNWIDSVYLSVMSVTTVGYGDKAFKTLSGRVFAVIWLLVSTLAVGRAFLYLAEARVNRRQRRMAKWVLHRAITIQDLLAADINHTGFISKSEYVVYKLKELGKIGENDISQICKHFSKLDRHNSGKITLPHLLLLENHHRL